MPSLADLQEQVKDQIFIVMRVYTAKPRTNGMAIKGLMHQPDTGRTKLCIGLKAVRHLHYRVITETGLTTADELLYPGSLPYVEDLISTTRLERAQSKTRSTALYQVESLPNRHEESNIRKSFRHV